MRRTTTESKVAQTILQRKESIKVGGKTYQVAPPSIATLILASEAISELPLVDTGSNDVLKKSLAIAPDCKPIAEVATILILGAKELESQKKGLWGLFKKRYAAQRTALYKDLLYEYSPSQLFLLLSKLLDKMEIGDFFGLTTFLIGVNLLRPTKVVQSETTAFGQ